jgi:hypothetical protein
MTPPRWCCATRQPEIPADASGQRRACAEVQRLPDETPTAYGTRVHQRFVENLRGLIFAHTRR